MGAEILYLHDLEVEALIPALIASIVGYTVYGAFFGFSPIFAASEGTHSCDRVHARCAQRARGAGGDGAVVVDDRGRFAGVVTRSQLEAMPELDCSMRRVDTLLPSTIEPLAPEQSLDDALEQLAQGGVPWLPVVVGDKLVGGLGVRDAVGTYKHAARQRVVPRACDARV